MDASQPSSNEEGGSTLDASSAGDTGRADAAGTGALDGGAQGDGAGNDGGTREEAAAGVDGALLDSTAPSCSMVETSADPANCGMCGHTCLPVAVAAGPAGSIAIDTTSVYWTNGPSGTVMKAPLGGGTPVTLAAGQSNPDTIAVDATSVYWVNATATGALMKVSLDGGAPIALISGLSYPHSFAVGGAGVYLTSASEGTVIAVSLDGGAPTPLAQQQNVPSAVAVDGTSVYWVNAGSGAGAIMKVGLGGGTPVSLASGLNGPAGIAVDATSVYWTVSIPDGNIYDPDGAVMRAPLHGGTAVTLASAQPAGGIGATGSWGNPVAVDASSVYWLYSHILFRAPLTGGTPTVLAPRGAGEIAIGAAGAFWTDDNSAVVTAECLSGTCKMGCQTGDTNCNGIVLQSCDTTTGMFVDGSACQSACVGGQCVQGSQCNYGDVQCAGALLQSCSTDGTWAPPAACDPNATCTGNQCVGPPECNSLRSCCYSISDGFVQMTCLNIAASGTDGGCQSQLESFISSGVCL